MPIKLKQLTLKDGSVLPAALITIIVGANNCGKTRLLKEIKQHLQGDLNYDYKILDRISSHPGDMDEIIKSLNVQITKTPDGTTTSYQSQGFFGRINTSGQTSYFDTVREDISKTGVIEHSLFKGTFGPILFAMIQTEDRLLASKTSTVHHEEIGFLDTIFKEGSALDTEISAHTFAAFGMNVRLDSSRPGYLTIRVGKDFSMLPEKDRDARPLLQAYELLEDQGDGFRSFATTLFMLKVTNRPFILIDEPEAFLHPPQAAALGRIIAQLAASHQHIFISTHSTDFLRSLISQRQDVNVVRLTRTDGSTRGNVLNTEEIKKIVQTPLLNSTRILDSLFYQGVVIIEGDSDRTFYEKIARQYRPDDEVHYIHSHSKQVIHKLVAPYVNANVSFAVIVDFDILREREDLKKVVEATGKTESLDQILDLQKKIKDAINKKPATEIYQELLETLSKRTEAESTLPDIKSIAAMDLISEKRIFDLRKDVRNALEVADKWAGVKAEGKAKLPAEVADDFDQLDKLCQAMGIFIVPCGSLESWLAGNGLPPTKNNKSKWITKALVWLDENKPEKLAVKDFVTKIHLHLKQQNQVASELNLGASADSN
ncbi:MAG TPA: AAA family ATPase [Cyclobacteriaceae bacterium]|nr:AAA family ATPase [Cyclobacteriaceae bacterium]